MTSHDSHTSGVMHPQHAPRAAPPYPITPAASPRLQPQPQPPQQPPSPLCPTPIPMPHAPHSSTLPIMPMPMPIRPLRPQSSSANSPPFTPHAPPPICAQHQSVYTRSVSHTSYATPHNHHAYPDGENQLEHSSSSSSSSSSSNAYGVLHAETEREYERRYRKERARAVERRPTLGGSVLSMVGKVGKVLSAERR